jgi:hypothetical protein
VGDDVGGALPVGDADGGIEGTALSGVAPQAASARALVTMAMVSLRDDDIRTYDASAAAMCQPATGVG